MLSLQWRASEQGALKLEAGDTQERTGFLARFKATEGKVELGKNVVVIGGGNTAMDSQAAGRETQAWEKVSPGIQKNQTLHAC